MSVFTTDRTGKYKIGEQNENGRIVTKFMTQADVSEAVKKGLEGKAPGYYVDELGDEFDPETDLDDGNADETPPKGDDDESDADDEDQDTDESETPADPAASSDEEGMGYPRKGGKTLSIFSGKPHETVKHVGGYMVPLTMDEYAGNEAKGIVAKTDAEILAKLGKMKGVRKG